MTPRAIGAIAIGLACVTLAGERAAVVSTDELEGATARGNEPGS